MCDSAKVKQSDVLHKWYNKANTNIPCCEYLFTFSKIQEVILNLGFSFKVQNPLSACYPIFKITAIGDDPRLREAIKAIVGTRNRRHSTSKRNFRGAKIKPLWHACHAMVINYVQSTWIPMTSSKPLRFVSLLEKDKGLRKFVADLQATDPKTKY